VKKTTGFYPRVRVDAAGGSAVGQAGGVLLTSTVRAAGLDTALSTALARWRPAGAVHDPAKVLLDLALTLARVGTPAQTSRWSGPSRRSSGRSPRTRRPRGRSCVWPRTWTRSCRRSTGPGQTPGRGSGLRPGPAPRTTTSMPVVLWSSMWTPPWSLCEFEEENAKPTFKKGFGFHPLCAFLDHGQSRGARDLIAAQQQGLPREGGVGSSACE